jgi:hypothetical protein
VPGVGLAAGAGAGGVSSAAFGAAGVSVLAGGSSAAWADPIGLGIAAQIREPSEVPLGGAPPDAPAVGPPAGGFGGSPRIQRPTLLPTGALVTTPRFGPVGICAGGKACAATSAAVGCMFGSACESPRTTGSWPAVAGPCAAAGRAT